MRRLLALLFLLVAAAPAAAAPIPVKVVVLTAFEVGADTGDAPGEFQAWAERYPLPRTIKVSGIEHPVRLSRDGVMGVVLGEFGRARGSMAALVANPAFDFSKTYWIMAGIAGVDPRTGSIGSAAWADWVVDGDPLYEIDDREIPVDWPWGLYAFGARRPSVKGRADDFSGMAWRLDPGLVQWAYGLTRSMALSDNAQLAAARARYPSEPAAQVPPHVVIGTALASARFWHGVRRTEWARDWVKTWTDGQGAFVMTDGEDQAVLDVLTLNGREGRVDARRILVLRTGSNYSREGDGEGPIGEFAPGGSAAAFEAAWQVGAPVVRALVTGWDHYSTTLPGAAKP